MLQKNLKKDLNTLHPTSHHISLELKRYHKGKTIESLNEKVHIYYEPLFIVKGVTYHMVSFLSELTLPLH